MRILWDEPKRRANLQKHGLDFADIEAKFDFATAIQIETRSGRTGRQRLKLVGWFEGRLVVVAVISPLGAEAVSVISLRPASEGASSCRANLIRKVRATPPAT